jgi:hypothetical protein
MLSMTSTDYILDSALVLLVLLQLKEHQLHISSMLRPLVVVGFACLMYVHSIPTAGNDLLLVAVLAVTGGVIGIASGRTLHMHVNETGEVLARAGWASACFWVLGMGSRFGFAVWISGAGAASLMHFSAAHTITTPHAWTVALLSMALCEVVGRTATVMTRKARLQATPTLVIA